MSKSPTTINPDWLRNIHPGDMLLTEFMEPLSLDTAALSQAIGLPEERLGAVVRGDRSVDADLDLRLGRYFKLSEGFFMRLQNQYDILEAKRAFNGELDRIVPRAA